LTSIHFSENNPDHQLTLERPFWETPGTFRDHW